MPIALRMRWFKYQARLVRASEIALYLQGTQALLRVDHQRDGYKPLVDAQMRIVEDRSFGNGELFSAGETHVQDSSRNRLHLGLPGFRVQSRPRAGLTYFETRFDSHARQVTPSSQCIESRKSLQASGVAKVFPTSMSFIASL